MSTFYLYFIADSQVQRTLDISDKVIGFLSCHIMVSRSVFVYAWEWRGQQLENYWQTLENHLSHIAQLRIVSIRVRVIVTMFFLKRC